MPKDLSHPLSWKYTSPDEPGFFTVVSPENSACKVTWIFRLNLVKGEHFDLRNDQLELNGLIINGSVKAIYENEEKKLGFRDSFYLPARQNLRLEALENTSVFIGGGPYEDRGDYFTREYDLSLPIGDIHQIHGKQPYQREVFMTVNPEKKASRLICGVTYSEEGRWTSWPPHQHTEHLEEVYCYFDLPKPKFALHLASRKEGEVEAVFPVSTGDCVVVPEGYHPTVGIPGSQSSYFWVMVAHSQESRRYDLAVNDPNYEA